VENGDHPSPLRISFSQPSFIPWGGFFARLMHSDRIVLLDDTLLARGFTYVTRNRIKGPQGEVWISVPLKRKGRGRQRIKDLELYEKERWINDFLLTIYHFYVKSIFFLPVFEKIKTALETRDEKFLDLVLKLLKIIAEEFRIERNFTLQSEVGIKAKGTALLVSLAKEMNAKEVLLPYFSDKAVDYNEFKNENIKISLLRYEPPQYPQFWGAFLKKLSSLDLLFCMGKDGKQIIKKGSHLYER
jgi:hypothetical protein